MAKGFKTGGRNWKKGESGNPKGGVRLPPEVREARRMNQVEFERVANRYLCWTKNELATARADPMTPAFDLLIINLIMEGIFEGDPKRFNCIMERLIGKVITKVEISSPEGKPIEHEVRNRSDSDLDSRIRDLVRLYKKVA